MAQGQGQGEGQERREGGACVAEHGAVLAAPDAERLGVVPLRPAGNTSTAYAVPGAVMRLPLSAPSPYRLCLWGWGWGWGWKWGGGGVEEG